MRMTIAWKLWLGFGVVIAALFATGLVIWFNVHIMEQVLERPASSADPITLIAQRIGESIVDVRMGVLKYLASGDARYRNAVERTGTQFKQLKAQYDQLATTEKAKKLGDTIHIFYQEHTALAQALVSTKDREEAVSIAISDRFRKIYELVHKKIQVERGREVHASFVDLEGRLERRLRAMKEESKGLAFQDVKFFQELLAQSKNLNLTHGEKRWVERLGKMFYPITLLLGQEDSLSADLQVDMKKFLDLGSKVNHILDSEILILARQSLQAHVDQASEAARRTQRLILLMFLLSLLVGGSATIIFVGGIIQSTQRLIASTRKISAGMLDHRVDLKTKDEFGELGAAFNRMAEELRQSFLRAKRLEAEKLNLTRGMSTGAAHEVKNLLTVLQQGADYLSKGAEPRNAVQSAVLQEMNGATKRARYVVMGLSHVAELLGSKADMEPVGLGLLIEQALSLVKDACDQSRIEIVKDFQIDLPAVNVDRNQMKEVFVSLFMNAIQAMPSGGRLRIKTYVKRLTEVGPKVGRRSEDAFRLGETVAVVDIEDTGSGISEEILPRIFGLFFTTKRESGGAGLGLAVVQSLMRMHGGTVEVSNRVEGGVKATLMLKTWQEKEDRPK